ncbi:MAG: hypothetical protein ACE5ES_03105, partial [Candidatus Nanoarchaeia archaeon]
VTTIGQTGNVSTPTDTAGPGWTTPGSIDFEITDVFSYGADTAKFEDFMKKGFVEYEDCFNSVDDDDDGNVDCSDWDCQYSPKCTDTGVNAAGFSDTKTPQVTGVRVEEYSDSALVLYETNKPANGTLQFYRNDSRCISLNATINDMGITSSNVRQYKLWHAADIYNTNIGYNLINDTSYYYKLKLCDDNNKCAVSKCSQLTTTSANKCGFCNFVTKIKAPTSWTVSYDKDQDGTYDHIQGQVCGANAGMKTNYTIGRQVTVKLASDDGATYFEFVNASLTKTGLNDKVRSISDSGNIIKGTSLVGLSSETRDKIINNLHPEVCRLKIPNTGNCTTLYHCDDNGQNCVDRTSESTLIDATNCVWKIPFCEFSTYTTTVSSSSSSSSSSGGGGGGGSTSANTTTGTTRTEDDSISPTSPGTDDSGTGSDRADEEEGLLEDIGGILKSSGLKKTLIRVVVVMAVIGVLIGIFFSTKHFAGKYQSRYDGKVKVVKEKMNPSKLLVVKGKNKKGKKKK